MRVHILLALISLILTTTSANTTTTALNLAPSTSATSFGRDLGVVVAPVTPFSSDGSKVNLDAVEPLVRYYISTGVRAAYVAGTTGESVKMTTDERKALMQAWVTAVAKVAPGNFTVIVHVGCESIKDTLDLTAYAKELKVDAVGMMPPSFFRPATVEALVDYAATVAAAAAPLPFFYYHIPSMTNVDIQMHDFLAAATASGKFSNLAGVKFSDYDLFDFTRCVHFGFNASAQHGPYTMLFGKDEVLLSGLAAGADGAVGSTYNYLGAVAYRVLNGYRAGNVSGVLTDQARIATVVALLQKYGGATTKAITTLASGVDVGPPRPPTLPMASSQLTALKKDLDSIDFFNWIKP